MITLLITPVRKKIRYEPVQYGLVIFKFFRIKLKTIVLHTEVATAVYQEYKESGVPKIKLLIAFEGIMESYKECSLLCKVID